MEINSKAVSSLTQAKVVWAHSMWQKTPRHSAFCRAITIRAVHPLSFEQLTFKSHQNSCKSLQAECFKSFCFLIESV
jgi:hypothetical protein